MSLIGTRSIFGGSGASRRTMLGNCVRLMSVTWVETGLNAVYFAIMARVLGPALYGSWAYGIATYTLIIGIAGLGFDTLILLRLGRDGRGGNDFLGRILTLRFVLLVVGALALVGFAFLAAPDPVGRIVMLLFIPALLGRGVAGAVRTCFVAYERISGYVRFVALFRGAEAVCGIAYLTAGGGLIGLVVLHASLWVGEAVFGLRLIHSRLSTYVFSFRWRNAAALLGQTGVLGISTCGFTWLASGPVMLFGQTGGEPAQLGQFGLVSGLTMVIVGSGHAFFVAAFPVLRRSTQPGSGLAYGRTTALGIAVGSMAASGLAWLLGPAAVVLVFGSGYHAVGDLLAAFLLIGGLILAPTGYEQALLIAGRQWGVALAYSVGSVCLAVAFFPAVAHWGLDGAVSATACGWLARAALLIGVLEVIARRGLPDVATRPRPPTQQ